MLENLPKSLEWAEDIVPSCNAGPLPLTDFPETSQGQRSTYRFCSEKNANNLRPVKLISV